MEVVFHGKQKELLHPSMSKIISKLIPYDHVTCDLYSYKKSGISDNTNIILQHLKLPFHLR